MATPPCSRFPFRILSTRILRAKHSDLHRTKRREASRGVRALSSDMLSADGQRRPEA